METLSAANEVHLTAAHLMADNPGMNANEAYHEAFNVLDPAWHDAALDVEINRRNLATMLLAWHRHHD